MYREGKKKKKALRVRRRDGEGRWLGGSTPGSPPRGVCSARGWPGCALSRSRHIPKVRAAEGGEPAESGATEKRFTRAGLLGQIF